MRWRSLEKSGGRASWKRATPWAPSSTGLKLATTTHAAFNARRSDEGGVRDRRLLGGDHVEQHMDPPLGHCPSRSPLSPPHASDVQPSCPPESAVCASTENSEDAGCDGATRVRRAQTCPKTTMESAISPEMTVVKRGCTRNPSAEQTWRIVSPGGENASPGRASSSMLAAAAVPRCRLARDRISIGEVMRRPRGGGLRPRSEAR